MNVGQLIEKLKTMPQDLEVLMAYDGALRGDIDKVWVSNGGTVGIGPNEEYLSSSIDRPDGAPTREEKLYYTVDEIN